MHQGFNLQDLKRKMEAMQIKECNAGNESSEERLFIDKKKFLSNKGFSREEHPKKRYDELKIDDFLLYSTLGI